MPNQTDLKDEDQRKKKEQLDSILDAALDDLNEIDDDDDDVDDEVQSSSLVTNPDSELNNDIPRKKESESNMSTASVSSNSNKNKNKNKVNEELLSEDLDAEKLEKELEAMMQQLLFQGEQGGPLPGTEPDMNAMNDIFSVKELEGLIQKIEKQQQKELQNQERLSRGNKQPIKSHSKTTAVNEKGTLNSSTSTKNTPLDNKAKNDNNSKEAPKKSPESDVDRTVTKLLHDMAKGAGEVSEPGFNMEAGHMEQMGEEIMENMMKEFEKVGHSGDADDAIDGMMKQLLSKDIMYEPMKKVMDSFPRWLAENKSHLSTEDYNRYGHQYQYFQRIVAVYETEPDNFPRLMELMQDIQEFGQPPAEIIKSLAPDLEFDEEGMPKMNMGMGFPGMPGMPDENCNVM